MNDTPEWIDDSDILYPVVPHKVWQRFECGECRETCSYRVRNEDEDRTVCFKCAELLWKPA